MKRNKWLIDGRRLNKGKREQWTAIGETLEISPNGQLIVRQGGIVFALNAGVWEEVWYLGEVE
jgi:hypothetical protein